MIAQLLHQIAQQHTKSGRDLARTTGLTEAQVEEGVRQLLRAGYLREEIPAGCESGCSGCMRHCAGRMPVFWSLTEKGRNYLANHPPTA